MNRNLKTTVYVAFFASISILLSYFEIPVIPPPFSFLKLDFAEVPIILCAIILGFIPAVFAEGVRSIISLFLTGSPTAGVGTAFNFVLGVIFALVYCFVLKKVNINIFLKMIIVSVIMVVIACLLNYAAVVPLYKAIGMFPQGVATSYYIYAGALPLNIVKWTTNSLLGAIAFKGIKKSVF